MVSCTARGSSATVFDVYNETSEHEGCADDERMGDVIGALLMIKGLAGATSEKEDTWFAKITGGERDPLKSGELLRGCSTLMRCWLGTMRPDDPLDVVAAILNRVRRLGIVDDSDLPMVSAILTCVVLDQSPVQWAGRAVAELTAGEQQGWILATWQVADLFDFSAEQSGAAVDLAERVLLELSAGSEASEPL